MDAITALHSRNSAPRLTDPAPGGDARQNIFKAALRAPDHCWLRPFRFLVVEGEGRQRLGQIFVKALLEDEPEADSETLEKVAAKPLRAPLLVVVIANLVEHPKVPEIEQLLSAGAAAHSMLIAAHAEGYGAMWRTGSMAYHSLVKRELGLAENERIIGYLYLGSVSGGSKLLPELAVESFFKAL